MTDLDARRARRSETTSTQVVGERWLLRAKKRCDQLEKRNHIEPPGTRSGRGCEIPKRCCSGDNISLDDLFKASETFHFSSMKVSPMTLMAVFAIFRLKMSVMTVLLGSAVLGMVWTLAGMR